MPRFQKHSAELKSQVLAEIKEVGNVTLVSKKHGISDKTVHNWVRASRNKVQIDQNKEVRELNKKLKDAELEIYVLKELLKKTHHRWQNAEKL
jgi:transposase-like protein